MGKGPCSVSPTQWPKHRPLSLSLCVGYGLMKGGWDQLLDTREWWCLMGTGMGCSDHRHKATQITVPALKKVLVLESTS